MPYEQKETGPPGDHTAATTWGPSGVLIGVRAPTAGDQPNQVLTIILGLPPAEGPPPSAHVLHGLRIGRRSGFLKQSHVPAKLRN